MMSSGQNELRPKVLAQPAQPGSPLKSGQRSQSPDPGRWRPYAPGAVPWWNKCLPGSDAVQPFPAFNLPPRMTSTFSSVLEIFLRLPLDMPMPCSMTYDQCLMMSFCEIPKVSISSTWLTFYHTLTLKHLGWNPLSLSCWFTTCKRERLRCTNAAEVLRDLDLHQSIFNQQHCTHLARLHKGIP